MSSVPCSGGPSKRPVMIFGSSSLSSRSTTSRLISRSKLSTVWWPTWHLDAAEVVVLHVPVSLGGILDRVTLSCEFPPRGAQGFPRKAVRCSRGSDRDRSTRRSVRQSRQLLQRKPSIRDRGMEQSRGFLREVDSGGPTRIGRSLERWEKEPPRPCSSPRLDSSEPAGLPRRW